MNNTQKIKDIGSLQKFLEDKFMTKILIILKQTTLNINQQYNIAKTLKHNYIHKLINLTDEPTLDINKIIKAVGFNLYQEEEENTKEIISYRMIDLVCDKYFEMLKQQIDEENDKWLCNRLNWYDDELNTYNEFY